MGLDPEQTQRAARLLDAPKDALGEGLTPVLLRSFEGGALHALGADRAEAYVTVLFALLLLRRGHELEPLHEDIVQLVLPAMRAHDPEYDTDQLAQDLDRLVEWECVIRRTEPLKIRGYKDVRRERFRYKLHEDTVALLEWMQARLAEKLQGRARDSRDLLTDVLGHLREAQRILQRWHEGERTDDNARRAVYLLGAIDDTVHGITDELLGFRAQMLEFSVRPYDIGVLREILAWLERYVSVYLARIEELRSDIVDRLHKLDQPRFRKALAECQRQLEDERARIPSALRGERRVRTTDELLDAQLPFFEADGQLQQLCGRIDRSARAVLRKMHRHLRELERRSARLQDLRARIAEVAAAPDDPRAFAALLNRLVASAHARFPRRGAPARERAMPPLPRSHHAPRRAGRSRPLRPKRSSPEAVRALRARRLRELRLWLDRNVLHGRMSLRLSEASVTAPDAPRRWLEVARLRHLARGRDLQRLEIALADVDENSPVLLEGARDGLEAPDCLVEDRAANGKAGGDP